VRRLLRTRLTKRTGRAGGTGRLSGPWFAALLVIGVLALLVPGVSLVTASQSSPAAQAAPATVFADLGCQGVAPAVIPAAGFITNPSRAQAGHLWWRPETGGVCIGTVIEWVQYNAPATKTWRVIVYSAAHPHGQAVAQRTFTLGQGWYWWSFGVHQVFAGLSAVCVTATDSFGLACLDFSPAAG
jgi:hypothetical protein